MDTEIIEYGGNSITLLTHLISELMYNDRKKHEIENIKTFAFKIRKKFNSKLKKY